MELPVPSPRRWWVLLITVMFRFNFSEVKFINRVKTLFAFRIWKGGVGDGRGLNQHCVGSYVSIRCVLCVCVLGSGVGCRVWDFDHTTGSSMQRAVITSALIMCDFYKHGCKVLATASWNCSPRHGGQSAARYGKINTCQHMKKRSWSLCFIDIFKLFMFVRI